MTGNVKEWFVPKFEETVHHAFQQSDTRLGGTVAGGATFVGDKAYFPRMGAVEAYDSPAFAQLLLANMAQDFIEVQASPKFVAFGLWDPHKHKYSIATAVEYGKAAYSAIKRGEDRCIIDALKLSAAVGVKKIGDAGTMVPIHTIGDYDTPATLDLIAEGIALLGENEAFEGEQVTLVQPFRNKMQFALDPYMASNETKGNMPWNDLTWRTSNLLPQDVGAGGVDLFMYAKPALVSGYNDDLTKIDERDGPALTDINGYWMQVGASPRDATGIVRIKSKKNFSLFRAPTPTLAVEEA